MRRIISFLMVMLILIVVMQSTVFAGVSSWGEIVDSIENKMNQALNTYKQGDAERAKELVNDAYFGFFEKEGMERAILSYVSGRRASEIEYGFSTIKKLIRNQAPVTEVQIKMDEVVEMLREVARKLDQNGKNQKPVESLLSSFFILLREGFEAILIIGAIAAYLIKSGNGNKTRIIYYSSVFAILFSFLTAIVLQMVLKISGANQEILEGVTMLLAVVVLFSVSHWMIGKSEAEAWNRYIENKVHSSLSKGNTMALGVVAFLAVYREGAETVLFYQALLSNSGSDTGMIWLGFALGTIALTAIFIIVRFGSMKIPLKPFFIGTSILLYLLAFIFAGGGVKELQEAGIIGVNYVPGMRAIDILGIYPTWETLVPQIILLILAIAGVIINFFRRSYFEKK